MGINKLEIKNRFRIGQRVEIKQRGDGRKYMPGKIRGTIVGIYEHFILVHIGKYRESFSYVDIAMGKVRVKAVRAA